MEFLGRYFYCCLDVGLPLHVRTISNTDTFKRRLKTYLFCKFYDLAYPSDFMYA